MSDATEGGKEFTYPLICDLCGWPSWSGEPGMGCASSPCRGQGGTLITKREHQEHLDALNSTVYQIDTGRFVHVLGRSGPARTFTKVRALDTGEILFVPSTAVSLAQKETNS